MSSEDVGYCQYITGGSRLVSHGEGSIAILRDNRRRLRLSFFVSSHFFSIHYNEHVLRGLNNIHTTRRCTGQTYPPHLASGLETAPPPPPLPSTPWPPASSNAIFSQSRLQMAPHILTTHATAPIPALFLVHPAHINNNKSNTNDPAQPTDLTNANSQTLKTLLNLHQSRPSQSNQPT